MPDGLLNYVRCPHCGGNAGAPTHQCDEEARAAAAAFDASPFGQALHRPPWSPHHASPESDPQALRYELDGCREKIAEQRAIIERAGWCVAAIDLLSVSPRLDREIGLLHWIGDRVVSDQLREDVGQPCVEGDTLAALVGRLRSAPSPVLGENGEGT